MVRDGLPLPAGRLRQQVLERIEHWERFDGTEAEKVEMVAADPEWMGLVEAEIGLEPMCAACREIRRRIASMESCHEHYVENVQAVAGMIGSMKAGPVLDCGQACPARLAQAAAYAQALRRWLQGDTPVGETDREVCDLLGEPKAAKIGLAEHLACKLEDNDYQVYADEDEDFERTESRIQHLPICNFHWHESLHIVLREIGAGRRLYPWHTPDGFQTHGDCPNRVPQLRKIMSALAAWAEGKRERAGEWGQVLGEPTAEKRWLVASLCKHVSAQHERCGEKLRVPRR